MRNKENVINWADNKGLLKRENSFKQFIKTVEEMGEVANALNKDNKEALIDGIGDVVVTLIILAKQNNLDIEDCLEHAWNEIKDRTGKTVNGVFIKN
jgi:NTP pyrophosphatase (non-canonical NTP hydrolase)